ncbi:gem-associated protein 4 [Echeneis naucrates]|uniref:Gem (nuclear organelle) associated protein 4 n=1 Tax=Echeneis naucrates TaxID=173247 RepID=A0A665VDD7_ECHNA|nr:gem-associated protein 4 [Echeneis naucrates]
MMDKDSAFLQGAFLLTNKLCLPSTLSSLQKADWSRVGRPVLEAVREICEQDELRPSTVACQWRKKIVCVVWLKLLCEQAGEDVETAWRENPFFPLQNSLPEVNHVVLLELVKSMAAADVFAYFLLCLPKSQICIELERLIHYVTSSPTREEDVHFFLEVWWELWKGRTEEKAGGKEIEMLFSDQLTRPSSKSSSLSPQAAKRLKIDTSDQPASSQTPDVLHILLHALKDMKDFISSTDLCLQALSVSLDSLYTMLFIDQEVTLPTKEKLQLLSKAVSIRGKKDEKLSPELIQEAQKDLRASCTPSQFRPSNMKGDEALKIITDLTQFWLNNGLLKESDAVNLSYSAFKLGQSVQRVLTASGETDLPEMDETEKNKLRGLLQSLALPGIQTTPEVDAQVAMIILSHRLEDYQNYAMLFAREESWACDELWLDCLEKNQAAFQQTDTLISLVSMFMRTLRSQSSDLSQCRKLMKVITDVFSALSLNDKNKSLAAMLKLSPRGFFGFSVPSAVTEGFEQELNMAFNCLIQGGAGASAAVSQGNLNTAASLVARVAFQNPEAALRSCCHSAVFNKGTFSLMAKILQLLPGLRGQAGRTEDEGEDALRGSSLLCRCLQDTIQTKSLSAGEKEQILKFLDLLMMPVTAVEGEESQWCFLAPQEVVKVFVLPNISSSSGTSCDLELSLQLLHTALCVDVQRPASSPHWVLDCSPFPLLYILAQLHEQAHRLWEEPPGVAAHHWSMDLKELLLTVLSTLGQVVGAELAAAPSSWSRALFWLYNKMEELDWTVRFHLKPLWGEHFKNEVPSSLLDVCDLPEQEWSGLDLPQYGPGSGLLAWMECCSVSDSLQSTMLSCLSLDQRQPDHVSMFSKGLLVALTQTLPWCSVSQWTRLLGALRQLIASGRLHVPFSLEYVDFLPLLDLRRFSCELRLSVLLLRAFQLLCGSSCSDWLSADGWAHVGRLYAHAVREMMSSVKAKLPLPSSGAWTVSASMSPKAPTSRDSNPLKGKESPALKSEEGETVPSQEVLFVLSQLFCHVQHIQVMMPVRQCESLFLSSLEILSHYEAIMADFPESSSPLESDNTRHFFTTITDNLENQEMKVVLQQKIAQLVPTDAH